MSKRPSLFAAKPASVPKPVPGEIVNAESFAEPAPAPAAEAKAAPKIKSRPPSREGKRVLSIYLTPEAWKQLRMLSLNLGCSTQALGEEAVNLLFEKHRLSRIA